MKPLKKKPTTLGSARMPSLRDKLEEQALLNAERLERETKETKKEITKEKKGRTNRKER